MYVKVQVNDKLGQSLVMKRGIRQGCPLLQMLFVILQDPFYRAIKGRALGLGSVPMNIVGYVDDTMVLIPQVSAFS